MNIEQQLDFSVVNRLGEQIFYLVDKLEVTELEQKIPEYSRLIEEQCLAIDKNTLTNKDFHNFEELLSRHKELMEFLKVKKKAIIDELKLIRLGKKMQVAYPKHY